MKVKLTSASRSMEFLLVPDEMDAVVAIDRVWFKFDRDVKIEPARVAAAAYVLSMDAIGNVFGIDDSPIPAHLAAAIARDFAGHELFIGGVSNVAERLAGRATYDLLHGMPCDARPPVTGEPRHLHVQRVVLGYEMRDGTGRQRLGISTNLDLFASLHSADPRAAVAAVLFLLAYDALGVPAVELPEQLLQGRVASAAVRCIREVGATVLTKEEQGVQA